MLYLAKIADLLSSADSQQCMFSLLHACRFYHTLKSTLKKLLWWNLRVFFLFLLILVVDQWKEIMRCWTIWVGWGRGGDSLNAFYGLFETLFWNYLYVCRYVCIRLECLPTSTAILCMQTQCDRRCMNIFINKTALTFPACTFE